MQEIIDAMSKEGSELYDPEVAVAVMGNKAKAPAKMAEAAPAEKKTKARRHKNKE